MSAFDAGRIVATADLDRSPFQRGLQDAKREARTFADGKYSAKLDADTSEADRKVVDLRARLERLNAERINPKVDLEGVTAAEARLAGLQAQMHALDRSGGGGGGGGRGGLSGGRGGFFSRLPNPGLLGLGIGAALPLAGPLAGVGLGAGASFLAPTVAGGLGLGAFAAGAKSSFTAVGNDVKKLTQLQQRYNAAVTDKQRAAVLRQEHQLWASLDPAQRKAVKNVDSLEGSWKRYQKALEPQSFGVLAEGAKIAEKGLRLLLPTAKGVGNEVENLASTADTALSKPFWRHFFHDFLAVEAPLAVHALGTALGSTVSGIATLAEKFAPLGHDLEDFLLRTSGGFDKWTQGGGPAKFVAFVEKETPIVAKDLGALAHGLEGLFKGLTPIGEVELKALGPVLNFIGDLGNKHPKVITAIGTALLGVGAGLKVIAGVRGIQGILGGIGGLGRGGGGLGGVVSKAAPIPVYVTNWGGEGGGLPGGGGAVKTGKLATGLRDVGAVAGPAGVLTAAFVAGANAYALTNKEALARITHPQGADIGYSRYVEKYVGAKYPNAVGTPYFNQISAQALQHFSPRSGISSFTPTDVPASVLASVKRYQGNVDAAGKSVQDAGAKVRGLVGDTNNLNIIMLKNPGVARKMEAGLRELAAEAKIEGALIGGDLGQGLIQGVEALVPHATMAGKLLVASTVKSMRLAANAHSPSRETERLAVDMGLGLIVGWHKIAPQVNAAFAHGTTTGIKFIENAMARGVAATQSRLSGARGQLAADLSGRHDYISGLTSSYSGYANITGAINQNGSVGSVRGFLRSRLGKLRQFVDILHRLEKRHLSPALLQEIADQGPDGGIGLGQSILAAGGIGGLNRLQRQIDSYASQGASFAGHAVFDPRIATDEKHVRELVHEVKLQRQELHDVLVAIRHNPAAFAHALADEFRNAQHRATAGGH